MNNLIPGSDPDFPPYGLGDGDSPAAVGVEAFIVPPVKQIDVVGDNPDFTRRQRRSNRQEQGYEDGPGAPE